ncbi:MAG: NUDIX hydrolase [Patescibacteria group bacterium]
MREIERTIVSGLVFSKDGKLLMGLKDPAKGGVYPDVWHIPGGGIDEGESLEATLARELKEEVGLDIANARIVPVPSIGRGSSEKTLPDGEKVLCHMEFNRFEVYLDKNADEIKIKPGSDMVETRWFDKNELSSVKQIPGGREFFQEMGYMFSDIPSEFKHPPK